MLHRGRDATVVKSQFSLIATLLGVVSRTHEIFSCGGVGVNVIKSLDMCPSSKVRVHYPFHIQSLHVEKLLRKPSYSVMVRIYLVAVLRSFLLQLLCTLDLKWMLSSQDLQNMSHMSLTCFECDTMFWCKMGVKCSRPLKFRSQKCQPSF